jgi:hypothetical protein
VRESEVDVGCTAGAVLCRNGDSKEIKGEELDMMWPQDLSGPPTRSVAKDNAA